MTPEQRCSAFKQVKSDRSNWESYWQTIHDYFYIEAENINRTYSPGTELDFSYLYDSVSLNVANVLPAGIANYMTPFSGHWMGLRHTDKVINAKRSVSTWYKEAEEEIFYILSNSNFYDQIVPFYKASSIYGTGVLYSEPDEKDIIRFYNMPIKQVYLVDDARQRVCEFYIEFDYTSTQAVSRFGLNNVSEDIRENYTKGTSPSKKWPFLLYIGERHDRNPTKSDNANMPIQAAWYDYNKKMMMEESGYVRMPIFEHRFYKRDHMPYGFGTGAMALMDVRYANAMAKTQIIQAMKASAPAWAIPHDAFLQPLSFNPDAINVYDADELTKDKVFPIGTAGDVNINEMMLEKRYQAIKDHTFYDVFLAFQNITKQMTIPEVMQKVNERMTLLGPAVGRYATVLKNVIHETLVRAWEAGRLPPLPDELMQNPSYDVDFTSVLMLAQKNTDMQALQTALAMSAQIAQFDPTAIKKVDTMRAVDSVWDITGADPSVRRDTKDVMAEVEQEQQMQAEMLQMQAAGQQAKTAKDVAQAQKSASQAEQIEAQ